jgi:hypothetical protein
MHSPVLVDVSPKPQPNEKRSQNSISFHIKKMEESVEATVVAA